MSQSLKTTTSQAVASAPAVGLSVVTASLLLAGVGLNMIAHRPPKTHGYSAAHARRAASAGGDRSRGARRRLLLGRPGRVPARRGRHQCRLRLCRRREERRRSTRPSAPARPGHAESVQVTFDPRKISYGHLLQIYFSVAHDPTELNRQGPDTGTQYRSAIFPTNARAGPDRQGLYRPARSGRMSSTRRSSRTIEPDRTFYPAEAYHQDFLTRNPTYPYIVINDLPKIENLKRIFPISIAPTRCWSRRGATN